MAIFPINYQEEILKKKCRRSRTQEWTPSRRIGKRRLRAALPVLEEGLLQEVHLRAASGRIPLGPADYGPHER